MLAPSEADSNQALRNQINHPSRGRLDAQICEAKLMGIVRLYRLVHFHFRPRRMRKFVEQFQVTEKSNILDVGGTCLFWRYVPAKPQVTVGNLNLNNNFDRGRFKMRHMDATAIPYDDKSYDIAFSNSVIEHVGDYKAQQAFAEEVRRVAPYYYVQTPNRWFFVEPHFIAPFVHMLPRKWYRALVPYVSLYCWGRKATPEQIDDLFNEVRLLTRREMYELFPDAEIVEEKFLFMTKSFIAVRAPEAAAEAAPSHAEEEPFDVLAPAPSTNAA